MKYTIKLGDMQSALARLPEERFDACVTDPPYGLRFMAKRWDYDVPTVEQWQAVWRVLKPGAHVLAFGGSRTYHRLVVQLEDAGFEIRDQLMWLYGTGFPKSLNLDEGLGTALKPAHEPIVLARKPVEGTIKANLEIWGTGALAIDACRVGNERRKKIEALGNREPLSCYGRGLNGSRSAGETTEGRWPANLILDEEASAMLGSASRFFYCAKANARERESGLDGFGKLDGAALTGRQKFSDGLENPRAGAGRTSSGRANSHPTVKPIELMRYLVRLVTPANGVVLDPFAGSGSTGCACALEDRNFVGVEIDADYRAIALARIKHFVIEGIE